VIDFPLTCEKEEKFLLKGGVKRWDLATPRRICMVVVFANIFKL
jgi:hypothetical protein